MMRDDCGDVPSRETALARLGEGVLDLLVVGGGIVGAGVARDAAMRGLKTGLIEQYDFAYGTSSRSSHLLHGGLRYLAQGHLRLVHEASKEKRVVHRIAPHLAEPLAFIFPTRPGWQWARWKLSIGVKLYDLLCGRRNLGRSSTLGRDRVWRTLPGLARQGITGAVRYFDGLTNDARLVIDTLRSAASHGATVVNEARFVDAQREDGLWWCEVRDTAGDMPLEVRARAVVNATGPWSDRLPHSRTDLRLTKGVHLVIDRGRLPLPDAVVMAEGSRILFGIPWGDRVILGTTDTDFAGRIEDVRCEEEDVRYVLDVVNGAFPEARLAADDLVSAWAGLRPLVADRNGNPSDISRRHEIRMGEPGWWDVTGGKLTTYRLMAEQTVDKVVRQAGFAARRCRTAVEPLLPPEEVDGTSGILPPPVSEATVRHYCRREWARHLEDVMVRRTLWRYYHANHDRVARRILPWMADALGWNEAKAETEWNAYLQQHCPSHSGANEWHARNVPSTL
ncbi:MAG: glycerol-3-phosphate dehydrogenase/oxidase [Pirellulales bacterium]|nr:glycerol-3-phosphate dehydrogenase/oxidase [Pirellulales bacterium]